ncbi:MAG: cardiolipin synthase [Desulfobulbaceae bacterium]|jgi:cardiolipin synthase|nr:cardiolipin synthase [Desulfobulbaceae bacterium]
MEKFSWTLTASIFLADLLIRIVLSLRVIMRKREASVTLAWLVVILLLPFLGAVIYLLLGENRLGQKRAAHAADNVPLFKKWVTSLEHRIQAEWNHVNPQCRPVEIQASRVFGLPTLPGNRLELIDNPAAFFRSLTADIDRARKSCFLEFYIWEEGGLADDIAEAVLRAAARGVTCRVLLDSIGSADFLKSGLAGKMKARGIEIVEALPAGIFRAVFVRIDLRNHRKIAIIDGETAYTGSQNLVDPLDFKKNENVGKWIDTMVRVQGPVVEAMTATFFYDWFIESAVSLEELDKIARIPRVEPAGDALVQLVPSGPGFEQGGIHDLLLTTIYAARSELIITSPYFVPDNAILAALKSASQRGVDVSIIVPEKNDSRLVDYASRARYGELTRSGVKILKFREGLLHSKTITVDNDFSLIGSVNLDMRSFWLNFELSLFVYNREFTEKLRNVQLRYIKQARRLDPDHFARRSFGERFMENTALLLGPLL